MNDNPAYGQINKESPFKLIQEHPDRFLWGLAITPALAAGIALLVGLEPIFNGICILIPNVLAAWLDERLLKRTNRPVPAHWSVFVVPVYIWQRIKLTGLQKAPFYLWCVSFFIATYFGHLSSMKYLEKNACGLVTQIIQNQMLSTECVGVTIGKETKSGFYKAEATLDNGNDVDITIDTRKKGEMLVQIVP